MRAKVRRKQTRGKDKITCLYNLKKTTGLRDFLAKVKATVHTNVKKKQNANKNHLPCSMNNKLIHFKRQRRSYQAVKKMPEKGRF